MTSDQWSLLIILSFAIGFFGIWFYQTKKALRQNSSQRLFWLGPIGAFVFSRLTKHSTAHQDQYILLILAGYFAVFIALLLLLYW